MFKSTSFQFHDVSSGIEAAADMAKKSFNQDPQLIVIIVPVSNSISASYELTIQRQDLAIYKEIKRAALQDWGQVSSPHHCHGIMLIY